MYTISLANPKGGSGKTTSALILADMIKELGGNVCCIDIDPNKNLKNWELKREGLKGVSEIPIFEHRDADTLGDFVEQLSAEYDYCIVDLEGTKDIIVAYAIMDSDLVLVPMKPNAMESRLAGEMLKLIATASRNSKRDIPHKFLLTRTSSAIITRDQRAIMDQIRESKLPAIETELSERAAFQRLFAKGERLREITQDDPKNKAYVNAMQFAQEVLNEFKQNEQAA